jgi:molybdopterin synthase catalytic subunit
MIKITPDPIDTAAILASVSSPNCGAGVLFVGTTRRFTGDRETQQLEYECYHPMALAGLHRLKDSACEKWEIEKCSIVHRIGVVKIEEASIAVAVSSAHRIASFEAASWIMDRLKKDVPIWKKEFWAQGDSQWVHPQSDRHPTGAKA